VSRAIRIRGRGAARTMALEAVDLAQPRRGQVRIQVSHAGVAWGDIMRRKGVLAPPWTFTPGYDVVGTVDAIGSGVDPTLLGRRVGALLPQTGFGGYAEHAIAPASRVAVVPDNLSSDLACSLGLNYLTAWQLLRKVQPGQRVLVHGAAGGVGTAVLDVARHRGLSIWGTASQGKHPLVRALGGEPIDYRNQDFVQVARELGGFDWVLDGIGGPNLDRSHAVLAPGGTVVFYGLTDVVTSGKPLLPEVWRLLRIALARGKKLRLYGIGASPGARAAQCAADLRTLYDLGAAGSLAPTIDRTLPLADALQAHAAIEARETRGKVLLRVG